MTVAVSPIELVGITDGGSRSLTPEALAIVARAELLCGGARQLAHFPRHPAERLVIRTGMAVLAARLRAAADAGRRVVVLASGDPFLYGIGGTLRRFLPASRLRVYPNVGAPQLAWARIAESWQDAGLVSVHGRALAPVIDAARRYPKLAILTDDEHTPATVARALLTAGVSDRRAVVCERLGGEAERVVETRLADLPTQRFDPLNVLLLLTDRGERASEAAGGVVAEADMRVATTGWLPGLPDEAFAQRSPRDGLITKREVRVLSLAALAVQARPAVIWDVGAGSGSVAIEAALLNPGATVYAIERDAQSLGHIRENCARLAARNVAVVEGEAPGVCAGLPDPDAIFVGGSGGALAGLIDLAVARLLPRGRLVLNLATLEGLQVAQSTLRRHGWRPSITQVSVARGVPVGALTRLQALNPVFIVAAMRED
jgi:precorrin-6Y C5,15-methyltransferase (decarboxylating)